MKRRLTGANKLIVLTLVAAVLAAIASAGAAYAYFTSSGHGSGTTSVGSMSTVALQATAGTANSKLYPGGSGDLSFEVDNPNNYAVTLVSVTGDGSISADSNHSSCTTAQVVTFTNQTGLTANIPANATNYQIDLAGVVSMTTAAVNSCQGATFSVPVTISVEK